MQQLIDTAGKNSSGKHTDNFFRFAGEDLRGKRAALPVDFMYYLNDVQRMVLASLESFGWRLAFIRRPMFLAPVVVLHSDEQDKFAILEEDGNVNMTPQLKLRRH